MSIKYILGIATLVIANGLATIAGLGGGGIALVIFILFFDYTVKDATIVVICSIFGATSGNISALIKKAYNGNPIIKYQYVFLIIPIMFCGAFIGILLNKYLPSIIICMIITTTIITSMKKIYLKFKENY